jgi:hypothetical protein
VPTREGSTSRHPWRTSRHRSPVAPASCRLFRFCFSYRWPPAGAFSDSRGTARRARTRYTHTRAIHEARRFKMFSLEFSPRDEWHDRAKFARRERHAADPALVRGAVPLLKTKQRNRAHRQTSIIQPRCYAGTGRNACATKTTLWCIVSADTCATCCFA